MRGLLIANETPENEGCGSRYARFEPPAGVQIQTRIIKKDPAGHFS